MLHEQTDTCTLSLLHQSGTTLLLPNERQQKKKFNLLVNVKQWRSTLFAKLISSQLPSPAAVNYTTIHRGQTGGDGGNGGRAGGNLPSNNHMW